ncbi:MAG: S1 RNA-binding domain-containing protein, partial [Spongiibacteraceae bacterium]
IGVHQDGLVHISVLSNSFVKDPRSVVKAGDIVKVKVMEIDAQRKRIALSMRLDDQASEHQSAGETRRERPANGRNKVPRPTKTEQPASNGTMAALFAQAKQSQSRK